LENPESLPDENLLDAFTDFERSNPDKVQWVIPKMNIIKLLVGDENQNPIDATKNTFEAAFKEEKAEVMANTLTQILSKKLEE
jgi:hypothetical protein